MTGKRYSGRKEHAARPPEDQPWTWQTEALIRSVAWRTRSISLVRMIDFLLAENMAHAGTENGNLGATYSQLEKAGISRRLIRRTIEEGVARGLLRVAREGAPRQYFDDPEKAMARYRLTWVAYPRAGTGLVKLYERPTDEWKSVSPEAIKAWERGWEAREEARKKNRSPVPHVNRISATCEPTPVPHVNRRDSEKPDFPESPASSHVALPSISRRGTPDSEPRSPAKPNDAPAPSTVRPRLRPLRSFADANKPAPRTQDP